MFEALNDRVIATMLDQEQTTESGIILSSKNKACVKYRVTHTNEITKKLQDKVIYAEYKYQNYQLPDNGPNGETYVVIPYSEILAVKE